MDRVASVTAGDERPSPGSAPGDTPVRERRIPDGGRRRRGQPRFDHRRPETLYRTTEKRTGDGRSGVPRRPRTSPIGWR